VLNVEEWPPGKKIDTHMLATFGEETIMNYYYLPLLAALAFGCGDKDEDTGSEDSAAPADTADTAE